MPTRRQLIIHALSASTAEKYGVEFCAILQQNQSERVNGHKMGIRMASSESSRDFHTRVHIPCQELEGARDTYVLILG